MASSNSSSDSDSAAVAAPTVALLFVGSGCAALIYELVWFHLLRLVIGSSAVSLGILLASFMGGMCLGSWALANVVSMRWHPLRVYAAIELAIGVIGVSLPWWLPWLNSVYLAVAGESLSSVPARAMVAAIAVLPGTVLMGATLPAISRWVKSTPEALAKLGVFYGANIFGAVIGCLLAGFVLLPWTDTVVASYVAAVLNGVVAIAAWGLSRRSPYVPVIETSANDAQRASAPLPICIIAGLSGFAALGAEVIWTRLLSLLFGSTVYTFAIILAVYLAGLGLGSTVAAGWSKRFKQPLLWLAVAQLLVVILAPYANFAITRILPHWMRPDVYRTSEVYGVFLHDSLRAAVAVLPSAFFWGASFPLALAAAGRGQADSGRLVGQIYAANTLGAIFGALITSAALIPWIGSHQSQRVMALVSGVAAFIGFAQLAHGLTREGSSRHKRGQKRATVANTSMTPGIVVWGRAGTVMLTTIAVLATAAPPKGFFGRPLLPPLWDKYYSLFEREGRTTTVVVQANDLTPYRFICIGGKVEASSVPVDLRCQRLLGHLAALVHPEPKRTLTVGMGTASTAGCFVLHPSVEEIVICEIEPVVRDAAGEFFSRENYGVINNERTRIQFDDARHFLATTNEKFDIITSDPINSWIRGAAALYSAEYFELCKRRLNPGGVVVQWIPLYEKDLRTAKCELATFIQAFPEASLWTSWVKTDGMVQSHDIIAIGQIDPQPIDLAKVSHRIQSNPRLKASLDEVNLATIPELIGQFAGYGPDLKSWLADAPINRDRDLRLEYMAGLSLWLYDSHLIFAEIVAFRDYPARLLRNHAIYEEAIRRRLTPER